MIALVILRIIVTVRQYGVIVRVVLRVIMAVRNNRCDGANNIEND